MPALYTITTRASGTILTAAFYNSDHQNHVNNGDAQHLGAFSSNTSQMRTQTSPGDVGSESLALSIADELARIRYMIALQRGTTFWYGTTRAAADGMNYLRNSDFLTMSRMGQAAQSYPASAGSPYTADCWYVVNGANQSMAVIPGPPLSPKSAHSLVVQRIVGQTGVSQMLIGQPLSSSQIYPLRGQTVVFSINVQLGPGPAVTLLATLSTGTGANASKLAAMTGLVQQTLFSAPVTPNNVTVRLSSVPVAVPSNASQLDVTLSWTPVGTAAANENIFFGEAKLEVGTVPTPYVNPDPIEELQALSFFYYKTFPLGIFPQQNAGLGGAFQATQGAASTFGFGNLRWPNRMRVVPTITLFNPSAANVQARNINVPADCSGTAASNIDESGCNVNFVAAVGSAAGQGNAIHVTADAGI